MSFLDRVTQGLKKTRDLLLGEVGAALGHGRDLSDEDYEALEAALLRADVGPETTDRILEGVKRRLRDPAFAGDARGALRAEILAALSAEARGLPPAADDAPGASRPPSGAAAASRKPHVVLVVGVNGSGKTTTIAKLASRARRAGESVLLVACDTFRAAAADQLEVWADRVGVEIVKQKPGADPASVAFDGMARAQSHGVDRVIVDTAGRLHVKVNLMEEVKKIRRVIAQRIPGAPDEILLVLDATTGQNGVNQAREFDRALQLTGLVLTKLDGTAKGGVAIGIADRLKIPIRWIGVGEGMEDLVPFDAAQFADALLR
ncbi:MAG: signal recognition particle-docking protein FtsY [Candidatus Latescibacteria bacterium]|nr:signal recognition particle-docking protein FtsY [Candidatus Latescibacterota bacterium]